MAKQSPTDATAVLRAARDAQRRVDAGQVEVLEHVLAWAMSNPEDAAADAFSCGGPDPEHVGRLGGQGCPGVAPSAVAEIALALGLTTDAGRALVSDVLALAFRLPQTWQRVLAGAVAVWRARHLAQAIHGLTPAAAAEVDRHAAPFAHRLSGAQTERLVQAALAEHMPEEAERARLAAADRRHVLIALDEADLTGTVRMAAELDLADALDLERAVRDGARHLRDLGSMEPIDVRRSVALGELARQQPTLPLAADGGSTAANGGGALLATGTVPVTHGAEPAMTTAGEVPAGLRPLVPPAPVGRPMMLVLHLTADHLTAGSSTVGWCDNSRTPVTVGQIRNWLAAPGAKVTVRPVIDTRATLTTGGYVPSPVLDEQIRWRDRNCVFPGCTRPAGGADLDHILAWGRGGPTTSPNLASLCRRHHNLKTHHGWSYERHADGSTTWTTPARHRYHSHPHGEWHAVRLAGDRTHDDPDPP